MIKEKIVTTLAIAALCSLTACKPENVEPEAKTYNANELRAHKLLADPWSKYLKSQPILYQLPKSPSGIAALLDEEQTLIQAVLGSNQEASENPEYIELREELELLKTAIPTGVTSSGYRRNPRNSDSIAHASTSSSGSSSAHLRTGSDTYYMVFSRVHKSSSPDLTRSVEGIVYNAELENLDQRIDGLNQLTRVWSRRTNVMSSSGVEGVMRTANLAYLDSLKEYIRDFVSLEAKLLRLKAKSESSDQKKSNRLTAWQAFENSRLPILEEYIQKQHTDKFTMDADHNFLIPSKANKDRLLLACEIGERTLYFTLSTQASQRHPFRLVDLGE